MVSPFCSWDSSYKKNGYKQLNLLFKSLQTFQPIQNKFLNIDQNSYSVNYYEYSFYCSSPYPKNGTVSTTSTMRILHFKDVRHACITIQNLFFHSNKFIKTKILHRIKKDFLWIVHLWKQKVK